MIAQTGCVRSQGCPPPVMRPMDSIQLAGQQHSTAASLARDATATDDSQALAEQHDLVGSIKSHIDAETFSDDCHAPGTSGEHNRDSTRSNAATPGGSSVEEGRRQPRGGSHALDALRHEFRDICNALMLE